MNECDKLNSYNALVSANHTESFIATEKPKTVASTSQQQIQKSKAEKEAERVANTGYSSSPAINSRLASSANKQTTSSSKYSGGGASYYNSGYNSGYSSGYSSGYGSGYSSGYGGYSSSQGSQYRGNNLDYNSRIASIRNKARETAAKQKKYEQSKGAGLVDFDGKYSFSIENKKVRHHNGKRKNQVSKIFNKNMAKQAAVAAGVIILEAALGMAIAEAKSSITGVSNEIKKTLNSKVK